LAPTSPFLLALLLIAAAGSIGYAISGSADGGRA
jgi:hypothetical protein